jgi:hypothetical protein
MQLTGTGSRTGKPVVLAGNYVLRYTIAGGSGCHWQLYLDGWADTPLDEVQANGAGSMSNEIAVVGLDRRGYALRVVASSCGGWSVTISRK